MARPQDVELTFPCKLHIYHYHTCINSTYKSTYVAIGNHTSHKPWILFMLYTKDYMFFFIYLGGSRRIDENNVCSRYFVAKSLFLTIIQIWPKGTHVRTFTICLNMKNGYYHLILDQNLKFYIWILILKSKIIIYSISMPCMNEFTASV